MNEWLQQFANPNFMPHGHCYLWRPDILWTHVLSDLSIGISYYLIPIVFGILIYKGKNALPHKEVFALFMAFIFFCGTTHFVNIYVTWYPAYDYQGWLKAVTAFTSVLTVIVLAPKLPQLINLTSIEENYRQLKNDYDKLLGQNDKMNKIYEATLDREQKIIELKREVNALMADLGKKARYDTQ